MKYAGMAFQMGIIILVFAYLGKYADSRMATEKPYFTIVGALLGVFAALYITLKDLIKTN